MLLCIPPDSTTELDNLLRWWNDFHLTWDVLKNPWDYLSGEDTIPRWETELWLPDLLIQGDGIYNAQVKNILPTSRLTAPFNMVPVITGSAVSSLTDRRCYTLNTRVLECVFTSYEITTYYEDKVIDTRQDIAVGRVIQGQEKIIRCVFRNLGKNAIRTPRIRLIPDVDYTYYMYMGLSTDLITWTFTIDIPDVAYNATETFYLKVFTDSTILDPKPVLCSVDYAQGG
jgi:hypothetical protein